MEKFYEVIDLCDSVDRKDLSEFLEELVESIKEVLEEKDDSDYSEDSETNSSDDESIDEGEPRSHKKIEEENYKVRIDENGFWSFVFSDEEEEED
jgi:hypothetical protein